MKLSLDSALPIVTTGVSVALGTFHLLNVSGIVVLSMMEIRIFHLMLMLLLLFLTRPTVKTITNSRIDLTVGVLLAGLSVVCSLFILSRWKDIAWGGETDHWDTIVGMLLVVLVLEAARRGVGLALSVICLLFFTYPFYSEYLPGVLNSRGYSVARISEVLTTSTQGVYGIPLGVSASYIILFAIYGAFLSQFGAGDFFFKLASRLTSGMRAAGAKTAVVFSTLLGMISGSAAGNVAVTGTLTIPMMKKEGYQSHQAGAIEAVVSTGGQMMPPVMGAAAFIMAEIVGVPYTEVMQAGLLPALLFFASLFFVVHLQAVKADIPISQRQDDETPFWRVLLNGGQYIIPFCTLIAMMLNGYSPFKASFISILVLLVSYTLWNLVGSRRFPTDIFIKSFRAIDKGTRSVVPIAVACAAAGIIAGILGITGFGSKISGLIFTASGGITIVALIFTMVTAIILGMGLPTTAAYLILATVVAPALAKFGVPLLTAHMFVFFYGCVSTITPPVALASYVAAGIADSPISKVGWTAFFYGITSYLLPFMFFFGPPLMMSGSVAEVFLAFVSGLLGVFCIAVMVVGYQLLQLAIWQRALIGVAGIVLLMPGIVTDAIGITVFAALLYLQKSSEGRALM